MHKNIKIQLKLCQNFSLNRHTRTDSHHLSSSSEGSESEVRRRRRRELPDRCAAIAGLAGRALVVRRNRRGPPSLLPHAGGRTQRSHAGSCSLPCRCRCAPAFALAHVLCSDSEAGFNEPVALSDVVNEPLGELVDGAVEAQHEGVLERRELHNAAPGSSVRERWL